MVVSFWASWCPPCRKELPILQQFAEQWDGKVDVVGVDYTDPQAAAARALVSEAGVTYPVVADLDGSVSGRGAIPTLRGLPYLVLLDAQGRVVFGGYVVIDRGLTRGPAERHLGVPA
ncbi:MAG: TlpA disulfide reductase family protein [Nocardioides sp.]